MNRGKELKQTKLILFRTEREKKEGCTVPPLFTGCSCCQGEGYGSREKRGKVQISRLVFKFFVFKCTYLDLGKSHKISPNFTLKVTENHIFVSSKTSTSCSPEGLLTIAPKKIANLQPCSRGARKQSVKAHPKIPTLSLRDEFPDIGASVGGCFRDFWRRHS